MQKSINIGSRNGAGNGPTLGAIFVKHDAQSHCLKRPLTDIDFLQLINIEAGALSTSLQLGVRPVLHRAS